jgi:hypothetical protein
MNINYTTRWVTTLDGHQEFLSIKHMNDKIRLLYAVFVGIAIYFTPVLNLLAPLVAGVVAVSPSATATRDGLRTGAIAGGLLTIPAFLFASGILGQLPAVRIVDRTLESTVSIQRYATVVGVDHSAVYGLAIAVYTVLLAGVGGAVRARVNDLPSLSTPRL